MDFAFQNLRVYQLALQWNCCVADLLSAQKGNMTMSLADQISRASTSIALNIAEGSGRWHKADKRNFFWIARGSVFECVAIIDILEKKQVITGVEAQRHRDQLRSLGRMLTQLVKSHELQKS